MQLKITTDYAIRIVYYLACRSEVITASELAYELKIPESYIPKITKKLKEANIITACEGIKGCLLYTSKIRGASFGSWNTFLFITSRFINTGIYTCLLYTSRCV